MQQRQKAVIRPQDYQQAVQPQFLYQGNDISKLREEYANEKAELYLQIEQLKLQCDAKQYEPQLAALSAQVQQLQDQNNRLLEENQNLKVQFKIQQNDKDERIQELVDHIHQLNKITKHKVNQHKQVKEHLQQKHKEYSDHVYQLHDTHQLNISQLQNTIQQLRKENDELRGQLNLKDQNFQAYYRQMANQKERESNLYAEIDRLNFMLQNGQWNNGSSYEEKKYITKIEID